MVPGRVPSVLLAMLLAPVAALAHQPLPVPVVVPHLETPPLPPLRPHEHEATSSRTREAMFAVAAQLRKQHGDKTSA